MSTNLLEQSVVASLSSLTDDDLLRLCQDGDAQATHCLLGRYRYVIDAVAYRLSERRQDAADVATEAYLRAFHVLPTCRNAGALACWIKRVATNVFLGRCRHARRHACASLDGLIETTGDAFIPVTGDIREETMQGQLELRERHERVRRAIESLTPEHRRLIDLFYVQERTYDEIVEITRLSPGTVKSRLFRARAILERKLADLVA